VPRKRQILAVAFDGVHYPIAGSMHALFKGFDQQRQGCIVLAHMPAANLYSRCRVGCHSAIVNFSLGIAATSEFGGGPRMSHGGFPQE